MNKKRKHKKQQAAKHPISESERVEGVLEGMANPEEPTKLEYDKTLRKVIPLDAAAETSVISLVKKDLLLWP